MTNSVETVELVAVRDAVAVEIRSLLDTIGQSYLKVGSLLIEAREDFDKQGDFLAWVYFEFHIKKSQAFNLMKIARTFSVDTRFTGVSMRVMLALVDYAQDEEVLSQAAGLAETGELTTGTLADLISPPQPEKAAQEPETAPAAPVKDAPLVDPTVGVPDVVEMPWDATETPQDAAEAAQTPAPVVTKDEDSKRIASLLGMIEQLKSVNQQLVAEMSEMRSERTSKKAAAPMLPQFKSSCMYARLGLSAEEASKKTAVNKAKRELVKLGYGEGHEAWNFIKEAVESLTS